VEAWGLFSGGEGGGAIPEGSEDRHQRKKRLPTPIFIDHPLIIAA
jgi:hypothetical protein